MIKITLNLVPVSKKNSQQIYINKASGKRFITPSAKYRDYERAALKLLPRLKEPIKTPCNVQTVFYMPTKRRCDLVNMQEAILDVLVKAKILDDDNYYIVRSMDGSRVDVDKEHPRTEIQITEITESEEKKHE